MKNVVSRNTQMFSSCQKIKKTEMYKCCLNTTCFPGSHGNDFFASDKLNSDPPIYDILHEFSQVQVHQLQ